MDVARFGEWASLRYTNAKVRENYARRFSVRFPNEELAAARPQQTTPLYDIMTRERNAVMGVTWGLEVPLWFAPEGEPSRATCCRSTARTISSMSATRFARCASASASPRSPTSPSIAVTGPGAEAWLNRPARQRACRAPAASRSRRC